MTILESYKEVKAGKISKAQFMERARKDNLLKKFISNVSTYNDTVTILKNKGIITESIIDTNRPAPDFNDELVNIILGYVKDPDEANYFAVQGSDYWPDWLDVNMQRDPAYQEYLAKQQSSEENTIDDNEDWIDPAGGMHAGDKEDPAAMYAETETGGEPVDPYLMGKQAYHLEDGKNPFNIETNPEDFQEWSRGWSDAQDQEMEGDTDDEIDPEEKHWRDAATYAERNSYMDDDGVSDFNDGEFWEGKKSLNNSVDKFLDDFILDDIDWDEIETKKDLVQLAVETALANLEEFGITKLKQLSKEQLAKLKEVVDDEWESYKESREDNDFWESSLKEDYRDIKDNLKIFYNLIKTGKNKSGVKDIISQVKEEGNVLLTGRDIKKDGMLLKKSKEAAHVFDEAIDMALDDGWGRVGLRGAVDESKKPLKEVRVAVYSIEDNKKESRSDWKRYIEFAKLRDVKVEFVHSPYSHHKGIKITTPDQITAREVVKALKKYGVDWVDVKDFKRPNLDKYLEAKSTLKEAFKVGDKVYAEVGREGEIVKGTYAGKRKNVDGKDTHSIKGKDGKITLHPKIEKGDFDAEKKKRLADLKEGVEIIPAEVRKGVNYELDLYDQPIPNWDASFFSKEEIEKTTKKVIKNLEKDPLYYTKLCGTGKKPKAEPDTEVKYKESTVSDTTNKTKADGNLKKELKKDEKSNVKDTLSKTEKAKGKPKGVTVMKDKGVEGKEKILKEAFPFKPGVDLGKSFDKMKGGSGSPEEQFEDLMKKYDWYYEMSDDDRAYSSGEAVDKKLKTLAKEIGAEKALELFNRYAPDDRKAKPDYFTENKEDMNINKEEYTGEYDHLGKQVVIKKPNYWGSERKGDIAIHNSIDQVVAYLKDNPGKSEREILSDIWGFERGRTQNNKKFAELLRRGLRSGKIARAKKINPAGQTKYYYYLPNSRNTDNFGKSDFSNPGDTPAFENKYDLTGKITDRFPGHGKRAKDDINVEKPLSIEPGKIKLKNKMTKGQLKERIAKRLKEAVMYKIGRGGEGVDYKKTTDRDLEDKLKQTGISFTKKNIS